ncbi:MAG: hypothetical protein FD165_2603 [Gammaproteobacteria bacterium]|nr:MAG: hypothetical protein FD165_2603 [Gammaproteobacteria bacterium]TND01494.1 MAG: hypothetical protein FD120_2564 [Gammaproteobacteria bacterium]
MNSMGLLETALLAVVLLVCLALATRWVVRELGFGKRKSGGGCKSCSESKPAGQSDRLPG